MKKIQSLFCRNHESDRMVRDEIVSGSEWVAAGEGVATRKHDGTAVMLRGGKLFKRYDAKKGKTPPDGWEACQDPDPITGHWPGWVPVGDGPEDKWFRAAPIDGLPDGTYELCGPHFQGNPEHLPLEMLVLHGAAALLDCPRDFHGIRLYLEDHPIEGIVWHHPDGRMVKIKARDFGLRWPR